MINYNKRDILYSIHIPKCGGSSLRFVLQQWYGKGFHHHHVNQKNHIPPEPISLKKHLKYFMPICIHGHFNNRIKSDVFRYYPNARQLITVLRDPLQLHVSNYWYIKSLAQRRILYENSETNRLSLDDYVSKRTMSKYKEGFPFDLELNTFKDRINDYFIHIGVYEDLEKSINSLADKLGFARIPIPKINITPYKEQPSDAAIRCFKAKHELEYAVYNYTKNLN